MLIEIIIRFFVGGLVVSAFALIGDMLRPKSFAGLFGAAPSVALATLGLTFASKGGSVVGLEGRSMVFGSVAMLVYSLLTSQFLRNRKGDALMVAATSCAAWFLAAFGLWGLFLR